MSVLDGGLPGDIMREVCLECERWFKQKGFIVIKQPSTLGG